MSQTHSERKSSFLEVENVFLDKSERAWIMSGTVDITLLLKATEIC